MSYAQRKEISGNRTVAIIIVALVHLVLGYAIVTGLAYNFVKKTAEDLKTFDVEEEPPPPPEEPPPPPEDMPDVPPPPMQPPPMVRIERPPPPIRVQEVREIPPPQPPSPVATPVRPPRPPAPPPPPPPPAKVTKAQSARGNLQTLFSGNDYPQDALQREETGSVTVRLQIGTNGRVTGCDVVNGSGSRSLDRATCRILQSRARFSPAKLSNGQPTTDTYTQTIRWQLSG